MAAVPMKIMLFSHICSVQHITGAEKLLLFLIGQLKLEHDCLLVVPNEGMLSTKARARGIATVAVSYPIFYEMYTPGADFLQSRSHFIRNSRQASAAILELIFAHNPNLVISNTCVNLLPAIGARALGVPVAWVMNEQIQSTAHAGLAINTIHHYSDWIIGISNATLQPFRGGGMDGKIRILYPSWDEGELEQDQWPSYRSSLRAEIGWDESRQVIGYISSDIYFNKGLEHFVHMAIQVAASSPDACFLVAGKPTDEIYYRKCLQLIDSAGLASRFCVRPFEVHVQRIYPVIDILVVPSLVEEGFGMTALEGLLFGKTVVTYAAGGLKEIMLLADNGSHLIEKGDIKKLAEVVQELLQHRALLPQQGLHNSFVAREAFGIASYRSRVSQWLQEVSAMSVQRQPEGILPERLTGYPLIVVKGSAPAVYVLSAGIKYLFPEEAVFQSWGCDFQDVAVISDASLNHIPSGAALAASSAAPVSRSGKRHRRRNRKLVRTTIRKPLKLKKRKRSSKLLKRKRSSKLLKRRKGLSQKKKRVIR